MELKQEFSSCDAYTFKGLVGKKEFEDFATLCFKLKIQLDFKRVTIDDVTNVLRTVRLEPAPQSNLVIRVGVLKRDPGMLRQWTESTVVVTKDNFLHVYPFKDMEAPQKLLQDPGRSKSMDVADDNPFEKP